MNIKNFYRHNIVAIICISFGIFGQLGSAIADPLMNREGKTLAVKLNGSPTAPLAEQDIKDSAGIEAYTVYWSAKKQAGELCINVAPLDSRLGKPERIDILIHEINKDRPFQRWKNYQTVPQATDFVTDITEGKGFCPKEFILTERLRYPTLPNGEYVLRVAYWGEGNWDRQDILLTVTE